MGEIHKILYQSHIYQQMFDVVRIVDAKARRILEYANDIVKETDVACTDMLGRCDRCENCSSLRALQRHEQMVKLEYVDNMVLLVISLPMELEGRDVVVEMIKDVSRSITSDSHGLIKGEKVAGLINNLNGLIQTDTLTGLFNQRFFNEKLTSTLEKYQTSDKSVSLAMLDVDNFKEVNDTFGRQAGDRVLEKIADLMRLVIRKDYDFAARYGSDDFMICFPGVPLSGGAAICERLRQAVEQAEVYVGDTPIKITISIGVAGSREIPQGAADSLISLADYRLCVGKTVGRNRLVWQS